MPALSGPFRLRFCLPCFCLVIWGLATSLPAQEIPLGQFDAQGDIGDTARKGSVEYNTQQQSYLVAGGGTNMWANVDAFHYAWKKASGDISLAADIEFIGTEGDPHRKACLVIRKTLDADAVYADAAVHADGLTSLQYREEKGGVTKEIQSNVRGPRRVRIEKRGNYVTMSIASVGEEFRSSGGTFRIDLGEEFFIGLAFCSHNNANLHSAKFSNVVISKIQTTPGARQVLESTLETMAINSTDRKVVYHARAHFEAPNWSPDGKFLLFNQGGKLYRLTLPGGQPELVNTGSLSRLNNDHGISKDGKQIVISDGTRNRQSQIYTLPIEGGEPKLITENRPSYWHGWSPDGKTLAFCGERNGNFDVYTIPAEGGSEIRLTTADGLDDGPEYSPDGQSIYFNSERGGKMHIWRMKADGTQQEQLTNDEYHNWFAHPSPNGRWLAFISYPPDVTGHPANKDVMLRLMPAGGGNIRVLAKLFGGQGTMNVPSWSPDSTALSFVSYQLVDVAP